MSSVPIHNENNTTRVYNFARPLRRARHTSHKTFQQQRVYDSKKRGKPYSKSQKRQDDILGTAIQRKILNWMKRFLIEKYIRHYTSVLDLCSGRGQDLFKYHHQRVNRIIMIDSAEEELNIARATYLEDANNLKSTLGAEKDPTFLCSDLRSNRLSITPKVNTVCCQLGLHYLWGHNAHIANIFHTITTSLEPKGFLLVTILDSTQIPEKGLDDHPYMWFSPVYIVEDREQEKQGKEEKEEKNHKRSKQAYDFKYKGRIMEPVQEFVITKQELLSECEKHSLKWIQDFGIDDVKQAIFAYHTNRDVPLEVSANDWKALRMYRCYAFQYCP